MLKRHCKLVVLILVVALVAVMLCACNGADDQNISMKYSNANAYTVADSGELSSGTDNLEIEIDWIGGDIIFDTSETAQTVSFYEVATGGTPTSDTTMHYLLEVNTLRIKYAKSGKSKNGNLKKNLYITVPASLNILKIDIESVSGKINIGCDALRIEMEHVSGDVDISGKTRQVDIENVSGNITVKCDTSLMDLDVETVSGNVTLKIDDKLGFRLEFDTLSGQMYSTFSNLTLREGKYYVYQGGGREIEVETVSGSLS